MQLQWGAHTRPFWEKLKATAHGDGKDRTLSLAAATIQAKQTASICGSIKMCVYSHGVKISALRPILHSMKSTSPGKRRAKTRCMIKESQNAMHDQLLSNKGTLGNTGARHIQKHCSAHAIEVRQGRNIRNGAAYLVVGKI